MDLQTDLRIDEHALDKEWLAHAHKYQRWADKHSEAKRNLDGAKLDLEVVEAEIKIELRENPDKHGIQKVTENAISEHLATMQEYQDARDKVNQYAADVERLSKALTALDLRRRALENLVELLVINYYSEPRTKSPDSSNAQAQVAKRGHAAQTAKRRKQKEKES